MKREQLVGLVVVLLVIGGIWWWRGRKLQQPSQVLPVEGEGMEIEDKASEFAKRFGVTLPENWERVELRDVTGGINSGIATREFLENKFTHTVLAVLPDPARGTWYEGWLVRDEPFEAIYTGKLGLAKGGYLLEYESSLDLRDHNKAVVTLERVDDRKPETHLLEGVFK